MEHLLRINPALHTIGYTMTGVPFGAAFAVLWERGCCALAGVCGSLARAWASPPTVLVNLQPGSLEGHARLGRAYIFFFGDFAGACG